MNTSSSLVSIVTPVHNAATFLPVTIKSVQAQTYDSWELILVDDKSTDDSVKIIKDFQKHDSRIKLIELASNSGAAVARNKGVQYAHGTFLAFLDADDLWMANKLEVQTQFMKKNDYAFTFTSYEFADSEGKPNGKRVTIPAHINYTQALKNPIIWTTTVMLDLNKIPKRLAFMPDVRRGQDAATWWRILREADLVAHGIHSSLAYYRRTSNSLSANKIKAVKRTWFLYRRVERLNLLKSTYFFIHYSYNAVRKRA